MSKFLIPTTCEFTELIPVGENYWYRSICFTKVRGFSVGIVNSEVEFTIEQQVNSVPVSIRYVCDLCASKMHRDGIPTIDLLTGGFLYGGVFDTRMPDNDIRGLYLRERI